MTVQICIGSSCYLKGSQKLVEMFQSAIESYHLDRDVILSGSFCTGKCNREGVSITVDDVVYTGITPEKFEPFFRENVLKPLGKEGK